MEREEIFEILSDEREYQIEIGKCDFMSLDDWIMEIRDYLLYSVDMVYQEDELEALHSLRKALAIGIACAEQHGVPRR